MSDTTVLLLPQGFSPATLPLPLPSATTLPKPPPAALPCGACSRPGRSQPRRRTIVPSPNSSVAWKRSLGTFVLGGILISGCLAGQAVSALRVEITSLRAKIAEGTLTPEQF